MVKTTKTVTQWGCFVLTCLFTYVHAYITLHYITLHYMPLHCIALHYIPFHYITLHYIALLLLTYISIYTDIHIPFCVCVALIARHMHDQ